MSNDNSLTREIEEGLARADEMLRREKRRRWLYTFLSLFALVGAFALGFLIRPTNSAAAADNLLYFSSNRTGKYEIYYRDADGKSVQITHTSRGESWGPVLGPTGILYFVSNASGQPEIYIKMGGNSMRLISSGGKHGSWDPRPVSGGALYFVSNRTGKNEIYYRDQAGSTMQMTSTVGGQTQFSAPSSGNITHVTDFTVVIDAKSSWQKVAELQDSHNLIIIQYLYGSWVAGDPTISSFSFVDAAGYSTSSLSPKYFCQQCAAPIPQGVLGELVYKIGDEIGSVGNYKEILPGKSGAFSLMMNDAFDALEDNNGKITIRISIYRSE